MKGNIYIGYQGIGKSSTAGNSYIDLESSYFPKEENWYKNYCGLAFSLAEQGYNVFISSHEVVRKELADNKSLHPEVRITTIYPQLKLKSLWLNRLKSRYKADSSSKNARALLNAQEHYEDNIKEMKADALKYGFDIIEIKEIDYKLIDYLN